MKLSKITLWWLNRNYEWNRLLEKVKTTIVWALPRWLIYWASIRLIAAATSGKNGHVSPDGLNVMDALKMWEDRP